MCLCAYVGGWRSCGRVNGDDTRVFSFASRSQRNYVLSGARRAGPARRQRGGALDAVSALYVGVGVRVAR